MKLKIKYLILTLFCAVTIHAQISPIVQNTETQNITKEEAEIFIKKVLWFCQYEYQFLENPEEQLLLFFEKDIQLDVDFQKIKKENFRSLNYQLGSIKISKIEPPYVEILTCGWNDQSSWTRKKHFQIKKKNNQLYLIPGVVRDWNYPTFYAWVKDEKISSEPISTLDYLETHLDAYQFLQQYNYISSNSFQEKDFHGKWWVDSIYYHLEEKTNRSAGNNSYRFYPRGQFFNYGNTYGDDWFDYPGWWILKDDILVMNSGSRIEAYTIEEKSEHSLLLKHTVRKQKYLLSNLPREQEENKTPTAISHPDIEVIFQPYYDLIDPFYQGKALVEKEDKWGMINSKGEIIIPLEFDFMFPFRSASTSCAKKGKHYLKIDTTGKILDTLPYYHIERGFDTKRMRITNKEGLVGIGDLDGNFIIPPKYKKLRNSGLDFYTFYTNEKVGLMTKEGEIIIQPIYQDLKMLFGNNLIGIQQNNKWGVIDFNTKQEVLPIQFDKLEYRYPCYKTVTDGNSVLYDLSFQPLDLPVYDFISPLKENLFGVQNNGKKGTIDKDGNEVIPIIYDDFKFLENYIAVKKDGLWGLMDLNMQLIIPYQYDEIITTGYEYGSNHLVVIKDQKYGLINTQGDIILPIEYEHLDMGWAMQYPIEQWVKFKKADKYGLINIETKSIHIDAIYDDISIPRAWSERKEKLISVKKGEQYGYLNLDGTIAIPVIYNAPLYFNPEGSARISQNKHFGYINYKNEILLPPIFAEINESWGNDFLVVKYKGFFGLIKNTLPKNIDYNSPENYKETIAHYKNEVSINKELLLGNPNNTISIKNKLIFCYDKLAKNYAQLDQINMDKFRAKSFSKTDSLASSIVITTKEEYGEDRKRAFEYYEKRIILEEELYDESEQNQVDKNRLIQAYTKLRMNNYYYISAPENFDKVLEYHKKEIQLQEELVKAYPKNLKHKDYLASSYESLGYYYANTLLDKKKAYATYLLAEAVIKDVLKENPNDDLFQKKLKNLNRNIVPIHIEAYASKEFIELYTMNPFGKDTVEIFDTYRKINDSLRVYLIQNIRYKDELAKNLNSQAWYGLLLKKFKESESIIREAMALNTDNEYLATNLAPALLLQGKTEEALSEYKKWKDQPFQFARTYKEVFLKDFEAFEKADIIPQELQSDVERIKKLLKE